MRKIKEFEEGNEEIKVYYDNDWEEFQVRFYTNGKIRSKATYCTSDRRDAIDTAQHEAYRIIEKNKKRRTNYKTQN